MGTAWRLIDSSPPRRRSTSSTTRPLAAPVTMAQLQFVKRFHSANSSSVGSRYMNGSHSATNGGALAFQVTGKIRRVWTEPTTIIGSSFRGAHKPRPVGNAGTGGRAWGGGPGHK